jgi:glycosyltransferase involved in cell wall biosynthesis
VKGGVLSLVYVGLLVPHKGVHTAIEALSRLPADTLQRVRLTILGSGHPAYEDTLRRQVASANLSGHVTFAAPIPRTELPGFLSRHHVLLLPSVWEEPLALIMQEGLASGLVVVGSTTGGTSEIIRDGQNGLLFPAEDAGRLAVHIERLAGDPTLWQTLAHKGQESAKRLFDLRRMVGDLEGYLDNVRATSHAV